MEDITSAVAFPGQENTDSRRVRSPKAFVDIGLKWKNSNKMEGWRRVGNMRRASGIRGLEAAEVMSLDRSKRRVKNKSLPLFRSSLQFHWKVGVGGRGGRGREGGAGSWPRQGLLGNGRGCQAGPAANIRSSHLCSQKPGVLPKASFRLHGMITLDVGQLLRAHSLPPSLFPSLSLHPAPLPPSLSHSFFLFFPHCFQKLSAKHAAVAMAAANGTLKKKKKKRK